MQGHKSSLHSALPDPLEYFRREMQSRSGRSYRPALFGIHRLIALAIVHGIRTRNVWRQRNVPNPINQGKEVFPIRAGKADAALSEFTARKYLGSQLFPITKK